MQKKSRWWTIPTAIGIISLASSIYAFHQFHGVKMRQYVERIVAPKFELINMKLDMLLTPEQIEQVHKKYKLLQESK